MALIVNGITSHPGTDFGSWVRSDMIVDEFTDTSGIDTSASNEDLLVFDSGYFGCYGIHTKTTTFDALTTASYDNVSGAFQTLTTAFPGTTNRTLVIEAWGARGGASQESWYQSYKRRTDISENYSFGVADQFNNNTPTVGQVADNSGAHQLLPFKHEGWNGGFTVRLKATFVGFLGSGETIKIAVGKAGVGGGNTAHGTHSGGGGGTFVLLDHGSGSTIGQTRGSANNQRYTPLVVAGGGGGAGTRKGYTYNQSNAEWERPTECDAELATPTGVSKALGGNYSMATRANGQGGVGITGTSQYAGGPGAGMWNNAGAVTPHNGNAATTAKSPIDGNPLQGGAGIGSYGAASGGYGGGGCGNLNGGGGGGGFSGGSSSGQWSGSGSNGSGGGSLIGSTTASGGGYNNTITATTNTNVKADNITNKSPAEFGGFNGQVIITEKSTVLADATLVSVATTATSTPSKATISIGYSNGAGTGTINTDIKGYVSKDGGTNWVQATLVDKGSIGTYSLLTAIDVDVSDATSNQTDGGVAMKWKITTHNQTAIMNQRLHAVSLGWK